MWNMRRKEGDDLPVSWVHDCLRVERNLEKLQDFSDVP